MRGSRSDIITEWHEHQIKKRKSEAIYPHVKHMLGSRHTEQWTQPFWIKRHHHHHVPTSWTLWTVYKSSVSKINIGESSGCSGARLRVSPRSVHLPAAQVPAEVSAARLHGRGDYPNSGRALVMSHSDGRSCAGHSVLPAASGVSRSGA